VNLHASPKQRLMCRAALLLAFLSYAGYARRVQRFEASKVSAAFHPSSAGAASPRARQYELHLAALHTETASSLRRTPSVELNAGNEVAGKITKERRPLRDFVVGTEVEGTIKKVKPNGFTVDVGGKTDAFLLKSRTWNMTKQDLKRGQVLKAYIHSIDFEKNQLSLSCREVKKAEKEKPTAEDASENVRQKKPTADAPSAELKEEKLTEESASIKAQEDLIAQLKVKEEDLRRKAALAKEMRRIVAEEKARDQKRAQTKGALTKREAMNLLEEAVEGIAAEISVESDTEAERMNAQPARPGEEIDTEMKSDEEMRAELFKARALAEEEEQDHGKDSSAERAARSREEDQEEDRLANKAAAEAEERINAELAKAEKKRLAEEDILAQILGKKRRPESIEDPLLFAAERLDEQDIVDEGFDALERMIERSDESSSGPSSKYSKGNEQRDWSRYRSREQDEKRRAAKLRAQGFAEQEEERRRRAQAADAFTYEESPYAEGRPQATDAPARPAAAALDGLGEQMLAAEQKSQKEDARSKQAAASRANAQQAAFHKSVIAETEAAVAEGKARDRSIADGARAAAEEQRINALLASALQESRSARGIADVDRLEVSAGMAAADVELERMIAEKTRRSTVKLTTEDMERIAAEERERDKILAAETAARTEEERVNDLLAKARKKRSVQGSASSDSLPESSTAFWSEVLNTREVSRIRLPLRSMSKAALVLECQERKLQTTGSAVELRERLKVERDRGSARAR